MTYEDYLLRVIRDHRWECPNLLTKEQFEILNPAVRSAEADVMADCAAAVRRAGMKSVPDR